jgi:hypothetical protein
MEVTLSRVIEAARQRRAAVTAEVAGHIALLALRCVAAEPRHVSFESLALSAEGEVALRESGAADGLECERELRALLGVLLRLSQSAPPALEAASTRPASGDLAAFQVELTSALIPINHAAAGRALARLYRETSRLEHARVEAIEGELTAPPSTLPDATLPRTSRSPAELPPAFTLPPRASTTDGLAADWLGSLPPTSSKRDPARSASTTFSVPLPEPVDLDIDVEFVSDDATLGLDEVDLLIDDEGVLASDTPSSAPLHSTVQLLGTRWAPDGEPAIARLMLESEHPVRSDVRELLDGFLAHTRDDARMASELRKMIGLDAGRMRARSEPPVALGR